MSRNFKELKAFSKFVMERASEDRSNFSAEKIDADKIIFVYVYQLKFSLICIYCLILTQIN